MYRWFIICLCGLFGIVAGCNHENPPEVVTLLNEYRKNDQEFVSVCERQDELREQHSANQISDEIYLRKLDLLPELDELLDRNRSILEEVVKLDPAAICPEWLGESRYNDGEEFRGKRVKAFYDHQMQKHIDLMNRDLNKLKNMGY
ncbi:hypothetical protein N9B48_00955 [bacterium]|nr:hypothetical protein [bacterium]